MSSDAASVPRVTAVDLHLRDAVVQELGAREAAERAVARGPGVGQVDNRITVGDDGHTKVRVPVVRPQ